jgi:hypothetical protein
MELGMPLFWKIDPSWAGEDLPVFLLVYGDDFSIGIKYDESGVGRSLIDRSCILRHLNLQEAWIYIIIIPFTLILALKGLP